MKIKVPALGRVVMYVDLDGTIRPATIAVLRHEDMVDLSVMGGIEIQPDFGGAKRVQVGALFVSQVPHNETKAVGTWHWPPYVPDIEVPDDQR